MAGVYRITALYIALAGTWVAVSDAVLLLVASNSDLNRIINPLKGLLFVAVTGVGLFLLLRREAHKQSVILDKMRESETRARALFENNPNPMWVYDAKTLRFLDVNETAIARYGYTRDEFLSMTLVDIRPPEDVPRLLENTSKPRDPLSFSGLWRHCYKDGQIVDVEINSHTLSFEGQAAVLVVVLNVSERRRLELEQLENERLRMAVNKEVELRQLRDRFMVTISHEFRNPLATITTSAEMLERYATKMTEQQRADHFARIQENIRHMIGLLDDLLTVRRMESMKPEFHARPTDLVAMCARLLDEASLNDKGQHRMSFSANVEQAFAQIDVKLMRHALTNLINNACKYTPPGGVVEVTLQTQANEVFIRVRDEGIGIPEANRKRLFEPFYRADNVGDVPGTGLGLAITKQAIELHGGSISIDGADGGGTVFTIALPLLDPATTPTETVGD